MDMYGRTKLFNIMSSTEFNRRLKGTGVESFSCHPGVAKTDLYHPDKMDKDKLTSKVRGTHLADPGLQGSFVGSAWSHVSAIFWWSPVCQYMHTKGNGRINASCHGDQ